MISDAQQKANEQNAKLGGVKTEQGKDVSKFNAMKHGILRQSVTEYESDFYLQIYADLVNQYEPANITEDILTERIALYYLKLYRIQRTETEYMKSKLNPRVVEAKGFPNLNEVMMQNEVVNEGYTQQITEDDVLKLSGVYTRYETAIENRLYKAIHELQRIQSIRKGLITPFQTQSEQ